MSGPQDSEIVKMYRDGLDTKAIASETGLTTRSVCRALVRSKVRPLKTRAPKPTLTQKMLDLLIDGASYADVAETFNVKASWLREAAPGYGWDGKISGSLAHALRKPEVRKLFHEIRKMPLDGQTAGRSA